MSRTPLFATIEKLLSLSSRDAGIERPRSAAAAGAAALSPLLDWSAYAQKEQPKGSIGIVGGGGSPG